MITVEPGHEESSSDSTEVRAALVGQLYSHSRTGLIGAHAGALILTWILWSQVEHWRLILWLTCYTLLQIPRHVFVIIFHRWAPPDDAILFWGHWFVALTVLSGSLWGMAGIFLFPAESWAHQYVLALAVAGISSAAAMIYSPLMECYLPTVLAILVPLAGRHLYEGGEVNVTLAAAISVYAAVLVVTGWRMHRVTAHSVKLGFEKDGLIHSFAWQKKRAENLNEELKSEIEDRKRMEDALRESEQRYRTFFEHSPISLWIEDLSAVRSHVTQLQHHGVVDLAAFFRSHPNELIKCANLANVFDVNETTLEMYQAESKEEFLQGLADLVCEETLESFTKEILAIAEGKTAFEVETVSRTFRGDRKKFFLKWAVTPGYEKTYSRVLVSVMDITSRKQAEELLVQSERIQAVGEMAGGVAHNFNNLLQIVIARIQMAQSYLDSGASAQAKANLDQILEGARMGAHTVRRLQDFARVRNREPHLEGTTVDLSNTVRDAVEMSAPLWKTSAEREGISIELKTHLEDECLITGNENELFEVVVNLLKNAVEALPSGGRIEVRTFSNGAEVILQVADNGVGIAKENLSKVLEPFWTTKGARGTGLGLASSYGIVRRHCGSIHVDSVEGEGATFTVRMPRTDSLLHAKVADSGMNPAPRLNVLIVDDMEPVLSTLQDALTALGQNVFPARSGREALEIFENTDIHVVICDLGMPEMNGWEVANALKDTCREKGTQKPPFVLLTGWGGQLTDEEKTGGTGIDQVIEKPLDITKLARVLRTISEREAHAAN